MRRQTIDANTATFDDGERHVDRMHYSASMLDVVRGINRGVVRGDGFDSLIASAFEKLVSNGSLCAAWIHLYEAEQGTPRTIQHGWGTVFDTLAAKLDNGWVPPCCERAMAKDQIVCTPYPLKNCDLCPLARAYRTDSHHPAEALATTLKIDGTVLGFMCVSVVSDEPTFDEKSLLLKELADDIAFALRSISLAEERARTEEALKKEAARRQVLMGASIDGMAIFDQSHRVVEANQRFADMLGYTPEEMLSLHTWDFEAVMPEAQIREAFADLTQTSDTFETKHRRKDGSLYDAEVSASGALVGNEPMVFTVSRDITEKKALQASLVQSDRLASMGLLAAGVAHEINNPLSYVLYNLESVSQKLPNLLSERRDCRIADPKLDGVNGTDTDVVQKRRSGTRRNSLSDVENRIKEALSGVRRIQSITRSLGTFSHIEMDRVAPVSLRYVIECALNMAFNEIKYRARLVTEFSPDIPSVMANEGTLSQVFLNLLINAAHAIGEGHVDRNEIRISTRHSDSEVWVDVRDTGHGIPEANLERIFEPFFTTKQPGKGTGLGLAAVFGIVKQSGGAITVESELGKGTRFDLSFPLTSGSLHKSSSMPPGMEALRGNETVLVVEDEDMLLQVVARLLRNFGYTVLTAPQPGDALLQCEKHTAPIDLLLVDVVMPRMNGSELAKRLRSIHPEMRVLYMSGYSDFTVVRQVMSENLDCFIAKPFCADDLTAKIREVLSLPLER